MQGQYAFAAYDAERKQVFAARDPSGKEPLYYSFAEDGGVSFANQALAARGLTAADIATALQRQNVILPSGDAKIGAKDYTLSMNTSPNAIAAIGHALIDAGRRVMFCTTTDMVQKLQAARRDLSLSSMLEKLDKYDLIVLDDLSYVRKDQIESDVK